MRKLGLLLLSLFWLGLLLPGVAAQDEETFALTVMHTNDQHAAHKADSNGDGGVARQAAVVAQIRAETENNLLLDAGDRFTGTLFHMLHEGQDNAQIMNKLGYAAMTLGNHEFDMGDEVLAAFIDALEFPVVNANIDFGGEPLLAGKVPPYTVLEVGGEQVGVVGVIIPETPIISSPGAALVFNDDLVGAAQAAVDELSAQGVNKVILLTHIGYLADLELAGQLSGVDIVIGGHSHTLLANAYTGAEGGYPAEATSASGEPVLIVTASTKNKFLGRLDVEFDANGVLVDWGGDVILLSRYITPDADMQALVDELEAPVVELQETPVGEASVFLVGDRSVCRVAECNLGNLITDAVRKKTSAQIVFMNGGGIRADIDEGTVTLGEVLTVLPFGNTVATFELAGSDVLAALENGVSQVENGAGRFLQVSGLRYTWDGSKPAGERIVSAEVWQDGAYAPLDPAATYSLAANDFMRRGGDGYSMFAENAINPYDFGEPLEVVVADYIEANSPVAPEVEGRVTRVDQ